jgi:hypothetical protein
MTIEEFIGFLQQNIEKIRDFLSDEAFEDIVCLEFR